MALSNKTKECTGSFNCRFRVVLISAALLMLLAIGAVLLFVDKG